jgi:hypothetical protein
VPKVRNPYKICRVKPKPLYNWVSVGVEVRRWDSVPLTMTLFDKLFDLSK